MSSLTVLDGPDKGRVFVLKQWPSTIGRDSQCTIRLRDAAVSNHHATLDRVGADIRILDCDSRNGIKVNDEAMEAAQTLSDGDILRIGFDTIRFERSEVDDSLGPKTLRLAASKLSSSQLLKVATPETQAAPETSSAEQMLERACKLLSILYSLDESLADVRDLMSLQNKGLDAVLAVIPADRGAMVLCDPESGELDTPVSRGRAEPEGSLTASPLLLHMILTFKHPTLCNDVEADPKFRLPLRKAKVGSAMCVPLVSHDTAHGVLWVDSEATQRFQEGDLRLLTALGARLATAISNARYAERVRRMFKDTVATLVAAIQAKDKYTRGHSERVKRYSGILAEALELPASERELVEISAVLHDVGKIGMPDRILIHNDDPLTPDELETVKKHPVQGEKLLLKIPELSSVIPGVKWHHESWDGSGYPDGTAGEAIPLMARIIAIADTYDAVTTDRPYQKGLSKTEGFELLLNLKGKRLDPHLTQLFVDSYRARLLEKRWTVDGEENTAVSS